MTTCKIMINKSQISRFTLRMIRLQISEPNRYVYMHAKVSYLKEKSLGIAGVLEEI
jgi:hypothetical protein